MRNRGHEVTETGPIWHGHDLPTTTEDLARIHTALTDVLSLSPDVLFNFRASTLPPAFVKRISAAGVRSQVWLPDDPVLYHVCYQQIVDSYDDVLHCGGEAVMQLYEDRHGRSGVNFPFWTGWEDWPDFVPPDPPDFDIAFLGNCDGPVRSRRYGLLASLPFDTRTFGRVTNDPHHISGGVLPDERSVARALSRAALGLSIPQYFSDYAGHRMDFPELAGLGYFQFPSRVIQFARLGLPMVSLQPEASLFPEFYTAPTRRRLIEMIDDLLGLDSLLPHRQAATRRFQESFSADARAELLERMVLDPAAISALSVAERAVLFSSSPNEMPSDGRDEPSSRWPVDVRPVDLRVPLQRSATLTAAQPGSAPPMVSRRIMVISSRIDDPSDPIQQQLRALQDLGHDVVHVRPDRYPNIVPVAGATDLDHDNLVSHVDRFRPEIAVITSPVVLDPQARKALSQRNVVAIGLSLESSMADDMIVEWGAGFDLHVITRRSAVKAQGELTDTRRVYLAPSADSSLEVANASQADVICVGDLDRNLEQALIVDRLRQYFDVQVDVRSAIGAGAICVVQTKGCDTSQIDAAMANALQAVVTSQVLLCVEEFDGLDEFFEVGAEIISFSTDDELIDRLLLLTRNQTALTDMRQQCFDRVVGTHLSEHRWIPLLAQLQLDAKPAVTQAKRIIVSGYFGAGNTGDEIILRSLIEGLEERDASLQLTIAAENPAAVEQTHGRPAFHRQKLTEANAAMASASAVVLGGGGLWHDYSLSRVGGVSSLFTDNHHSLTGYGKVPILGVLHGLPFYVFGVGVGPLDNPDSGPVLRYLAQSATAITVRDESSKELLSQIDRWDQPIDVQPDLAYALRLRSQGHESVDIAAPPSNRPTIVVSLRPWDLDSADGWLFTVAHALQRVVDELGCDLVGLPMQKGAASDEFTLDRVFAMVETPGSKTVLPWTGDIDETASVLASADVVLAMRLHAAVMAHRVGRPVVGLAYDPKVHNHFSELGVPERSLDLSASAEEIVVNLAALMSGDPQAQNIASRVASLEERAARALDDLAAVLGQAVH